MANSISYTNCTQSNVITNTPGLKHGTYELQSLLKQLKAIAHTNDGGSGVTPLNIQSGTYDLHDIVKQLANVTHTNTIRDITNTCCNCNIWNCNCRYHSH